MADTSNHPPPYVQHDVRVGDGWFGHVSRVDGRAITITSPLWPSLPPEGVQVELRVTYVSPYLSLLEEPGP